MTAFLLSIQIAILTITVPPAPPSLAPPAGEQAQLHASAVGDQIYECDGTKWNLWGPDAKLTGDAGEDAGSHSKGPVWKWSDGSEVKGKPVATAPGDGNAIPLVLLTVTEHSGEGALAKITSIQRLNTNGGKAPANGCDAAHTGEKTRSHYTADYYFYAPAR